MIAELWHLPLASQIVILEQLQPEEGLQEKVHSRVHGSGISSFITFSCNPTLHHFARWALIRHMQEKGWMLQRGQEAATNLVLRAASA